MEKKQKDDYQIPIYFKQHFASYFLKYVEKLVWIYLKYLLYNFKHIRWFNVTIATLVNTQYETLLPWSDFLQKMREKLTKSVWRSEIYEITNVDYSKLNMKIRISYYKCCEYLYQVLMIADHHICWSANSP
jgi:hypothetical protein